MMILSHVCADFRDWEGRVLFSVSPADRLRFVDAPEAIREDPLYALLLAEGSLQVVDPSNRKQLENDPVSGHDASGKKASGLAAAVSNASRVADPSQPADAAGAEAPVTESKKTSSRTKS